MRQKVILRGDLTRVPCLIPCHSLVWSYSLPLLSDSISSLNFWISSHSPSKHWVDFKKFVYLIWVLGRVYASSHLIPKTTLQVLLHFMDKDDQQRDQFAQHLTDKTLPFELDPVNPESSTAAHLNCWCGVLLNRHILHIMIFRHLRKSFCLGRECPSQGSPVLLDTEGLS